MIKKTPHVLFNINLKHGAVKVLSTVTSTISSIETVLPEYILRVDLLKSISLDWTVSSKLLTLISLYLYLIAI